MGCQVCELKSEERWKVLFKDKGKWLVGLYFPESPSREEIIQLEMHDSPELFYLVEGDVTLVLEEEPGNIIQVPLSKRQAIVVETWHNAYRPSGKYGLCLVIERDGVKTEFKEMKEKFC